MRIFPVCSILNAMSANLPPAYKEAEKRFRVARDTAEKIAVLKEMISLLPKHKGTDKIFADLKRKMAKLKREPKKKSVGRRDNAFLIDREGAGQIALVGAANSGKSSLVDALTNAQPAVSEAPFTTWEPLPGMMYFENVQIQLVDTPPLSHEYNEPLLFDLIKRADIVAVVVDVTADPLGQLHLTLELLDTRSIRAAAPGEEPDYHIKKTVVLANKYDGPDQDEDLEIFTELLDVELPVMGLSARTKRNLEAFREEMFRLLGVIRVYTKAAGKEPDFTQPFVLKSGTTVEELAEKVHKDFGEKLKEARLWGEGLFDGQLVSRDHVLKDGNIVELKI